MKRATEQSLIFKGHLVLEILNDRKWKTRRVVEPKQGGSITGPMGPGMAGEYLGIDNEGRGCVESLICPYGQPGDRIWVRETWQHSNFPLGPYDETCSVFYRADFLDDPHGPDGEKSPEGRYRKWRSPIHMFRSASRITLEIVAVGVDRLQAISTEDAIAEGTRGGHGAIRGYPYNATPQEHFQHVWEEINGPGSWAVNPWVWVIEFRRVAP